MDYSTDKEASGLIPTFEAFLMYLLIVFLIYLGITSIGATEQKEERRRRRRLHRHSLLEDHDMDLRARRRRSDLLDSQLETDILLDLFKTDGNAGRVQEVHENSANLSSPPAPEAPVTVTVPEFNLKNVEEEAQAEAGKTEDNLDLGLGSISEARLATEETPRGRPRKPRRSRNKGRSTSGFRKVSK